MKNQINHLRLKVSIPVRGGRFAIELFDKNCVQQRFGGDDPDLVGFYFDIRTKVERLDRVLQRLGMRLWLKRDLRLE